MAENAQAQETSTEIIVISYSGQLVDAQSFARSRAKEYAAERSRPVTVKLVRGLTGGEVIAESTQQPPTRPTDILQKAQGTEQSDPAPTDSRVTDMHSGKGREQIGYGESDDGGVAEISPAAQKAQLQTFQGNIARETSGLIPSLEAVMMDIPNTAISKFTSLLPLVFKSLLPAGSIPGLTKSGPVSLNSLLTLAGGAALGSAANQVLRSSFGGINAVSGLTGVIGAVALAKVVGGNGSALPNNLSKSYPKNANYSNAVLATAVGSVATVALRNLRTGVPLNSQVLGLAANVALRTSRTSLSVPTSVLGLASTAALKPLSSILGVAVGGRVPIRPTNLSLANTGVLSGISQNIAANLVSNIIPRSQISGLLPPNLQRQIPRVPPRINSPYQGNSVTINRGAAPESVPAQPRSGRPEKDALVSGGPIRYEEKISQYFSLGDLSANAGLFRYNIVPGRSSPEETKTNLSALAVNCLDPIKQQFPGMRINCGYRGPGSTNYSASDHGIGCAADLQWGGLSNNVHLDIAKWIMANLQFKQLIFEHSAATGLVWIHVAFKKGSNNRNLLTMINGQYDPGITLHYGTRRA